ncbi:CD226 antigen isoform X2 [Nerophis ophidion]|uniref:CD226 antigen isoform X2 n=1 Tax=Nerophis ophidion TaxID=159077 RepID=UPI002ADF7C4B|nr:CD226 antigen isoform X2 [Nerophis ophidion]
MRVCLCILSYQRANMNSVLCLSDPRVSRKLQLVVLFHSGVINAAFILLCRAKMDVVQKERWYFMVLLLLTSLKGACPGAVQDKETITIHLQEGMLLDCLCPWDANLTMVSWTKDPDPNSIAVFHPEYGVATTYHYRNRIEFLRTTPMDGSITMRNVTHQDIGVYRCSLQTFPQGPWNRIIQVEDLDEPPADEAEENAAVVEAESHLTAAPNNNLTIECSHGHNGTVLQSVVEHMALGHPWVIVGICKRVEGGTLSEDYSERGHVSCEDSLDISLHLTAVAQEDDGFYRCSFSTDAGLKTSTVMVTVPATGGFSLSVYMMFVYLGTATAGLILLTILIIIILLRRRKKSRTEEVRDKLHPSHTQVRVSPERWRRWWARELTCTQVY